MNRPADQVSVTTCVHVAFVWSLWVGELVRVGDRVRVCAGEGLPRLHYMYMYMLYTCMRGGDFTR